MIDLSSAMNQKLERFYTSDYQNSAIIVRIKQNLFRFKRKSCA